MLIVVVECLLLVWLSCTFLAGAPKAVAHWKLKDEDVVPVPEIYSEAKDGSDWSTDPIIKLLMGQVSLIPSEQYLRDPVERDPVERDPAERDPVTDIRCTEASPVAESSHHSHQTLSQSCQQSENEQQKSSQSKVCLNKNIPKELICTTTSTEVTAYDFLEGIAKRRGHKPYPEPEVAMIFKTSDNEEAIDLTEVEQKLKKSIKEHPNSTRVLNQIGNYWRIRGHTFRAIECFRRALLLSPKNADVLLNLARVLFNLRYHEDAIFLTRESLKHSLQTEVWLQHYTLGEIFKSIGKTAEAVKHFKRAIELNPSFHAAEIHLRELKGSSSVSANLYTVVIILALTFIVLVLIYKLIVTATTQ